MTTKDDQPQRTMVSKIIGLFIEPQCTQRMDVLWAEFGLPPNYSPPFADSSRVRPSTYYVVQLPVITKASPPVIQTIAQGPFDDPCYAYHDVGAQNDDQYEN